MFGEINKQVADKLVGKKIEGVVSNGNVLVLKLSDKSELEIREEDLLGADGGLYKSTVLYLRIQKLANRLFKRAGFSGVLFRT